MLESTMGAPEGLRDSFYGFSVGHTTP
jgi:hypothetical protein